MPWPTILWTPSADAVDNLLKEGFDREKIQNVGNIMIDSLEMMRAKIEAADAFGGFGLSKGNYGLITLHRPSNVDSQESLSTLCQMLIGVSTKTPFVFPIHPRTRKNLDTFGLMDTLRNAEGIILTEPMNYIRFHESRIQLPICHHGFRGNPGGDHLPRHPLFNHASQYGTAGYGEPGHQSACAPWKTCSVASKASSAGEVKPHAVPELWDGHTAGRIVESIRTFGQSLSIN